MKRLLSHTTVVAVAMASALATAAIAFAQEAAAPAAPQSLIARRCQAEIAKLCPGMEPGGGRVAKCLRSRQADLSEPCQAALAAGWRGARAPAPTATSAPAERAPGPSAAAPSVAAPPAPAPPSAVPRPPQAGPGGGARPRAGMGMNAPSEWGPMASMRRACAAESTKLCRDVKPGHGRIAICLHEHPQDLSAPCQASVEQVMRQMSSPVGTHQACANDVRTFCDDVPPGTGRVAFCLGEHSAELSPDCKKRVAEMKDSWAKRSFGPPKGAAPALPPAPGATPAAPPPPPPAPRK